MIIVMGDYATREWCETAPCNCDKELGERFPELITETGHMWGCPKHILVARFGIAEARQKPSELDTAPGAEQQVESEHES